VTVLEVVPSLLRALVDELDDAARCPPLSLRWLMATGEALPPDLVRRWLAHYPRIPVVNAFGPTECSDDVAQHALEVSPPAGAVHVPVGAPLANTQLYVLDESLGLVPVGAPGELYVGGVGVGRGYLREPARTAQAFIPDPFARDSGARLYRTGDRARWRDGGVVEFLGRLDHQVKLRGFRIELAEIEVVLRRHPDVRDAAALLRDGRLIAYVVGAADPAALRAHARDHLPEYMVPTTWVPLPALPTTASGKLDRGALPPPPEEAHAGAGQAVVPPRTATEREVAAIWTDVLGVAALGTEQRFFDVGGDSLKLVRVYRRLCELYPGLVTIVELFQHATVADISRCIDKRRGRAEAPALEAFEI
jgi:acyl-coenzyme A synthetase/AMP-(fatty) acid ligase